jgi:hypothetical protein
VIPKTGCHDRSLTDEVKLCLGGYQLASPQQPYPEMPFAYLLMTQSFVSSSAVKVAASSAFAPP